ncbi:MAG: DUF1761 domain-containing protein [Flavobacteriia bacterium]|nr:DUF1761 domain-containing protein [Flavobacteriia bacterium]
MEEVKINFVAILVAVVANFIFGFIWYTPLFGKAWGKEMGFDMNEKPKMSELAKGMIVMVIGNFFLAWVLAHNMMAWTFVPGMKEMTPMASAMSAGVFTWLGFYLPVDIGTVFWERKSWKLFAINTGYHFFMVLIAAIILANM